MTVQNATTNVVDFQSERARRRSRESQPQRERTSPPHPRQAHPRGAPPTLEDAALTLLGISAESHDFLFLDAADIVAKLDPVYTAIIASLTPEARRRL